MHRKIRPLLFFFIVILYFSSLSFEDSQVNVGDKNEENFNDLKTAGYWTINPFKIDDSGGGGNGTWDWAVSKPWCRGGGTWGNPYIIENVTINGNGFQNCISIFNSDKFFIIKNCTLSNANGGGDRAGIQLYDVDNAKIIENKCLNNDDKGIIVARGKNNTLFNNTVKGSYRGIWLAGGFGESRNHTISNNIIENNKYGMVIGSSPGSTENITIKGNMVINSEYDGIKLERVNNSRILGNTVSYSNENGIYLYHSNYNIVKNNILIGNGKCILDEGLDNIIENNDCGDDGHEEPDIPPPDPFIIIIIAIIVIAGIASLLILIAVIKKQRRYNKDMSKFDREKAKARAKMRKKAMKGKR